MVLLICCLSAARWSRQVVSLGARDEQAAGEDDGQRATQHDGGQPTPERVGTQGTAEAAWALTVVLARRQVVGVRSVGEDAGKVRHSFFQSKSVRELARRPFAAATEVTLD